jgi:hypothetical protein
METINAPISPGELLDKITILEIKSERIADEDKLVNVRRELGILKRTWSGSINEDDVIIRLHSELKSVNESLWEIEDQIREKERAKEFDDRFIELARSVYHTNDRRSKAKKDLNLHLGSAIVEEKSYQDYD